MRRIESWLVMGSICFLWAGSAQAGPKNVIVMIGDGFGFEQADLGRLLADGGTLALDLVDPNPGSVDVSNVFGEITDSAAGATALATGCKTENGNISMAEDDMTILQTNMQVAQVEGMAVGILSSVYMCDATPGVWLAHASSRSCSTIIPQQIMACPDVFLGAGEKTPYRRGGKGKQAFDFIADFVENCNYQEVGNAAELAAATAPNDRLIGIWGGYTLLYAIDQQNDLGYNLPSLAEMTAKAIDVLKRDPDGFMLVIEGGAIDWMAHNKDVAGTGRDVVAFDEAVAVAYNFADIDGDTALIITADHETGGLGLGDSPDEDIIKGVTASTDWMWGQVHREEMDVEVVLLTYAGVGDTSPALTGTELTAIAAHGEMAISDALNDRMNVIWGKTLETPPRAPDEGDHSDLEVPVWTFGPGTAGELEGSVDNTEIGKLIFDLVTGVGGSAPACPVVVP